MLCSHFQYSYNCIRPKIKSCVLQVTRPSLNFYPDPNFFEQFSWISKEFSQSVIMFPYHDDTHVNFLNQNLKKSDLPFLI